MQSQALRNLATAVSEPILNRPFYKVLVLGGGSAGLAVSSQLSNHPIFASGGIGIVEPNPVHFYQPLWTLVGGGIRSLKESRRELKGLIPSHAKHINSSVVSLNPKAKVVTLEDGSQVGYEVLVVATGFKLDWEKIEGLKDALGKNGVSSNYDVGSVEKTFENIKSFKGGNALFTQPSTPIKCAGAPQKIMYLAEDYWSSNGMRSKANISFYTGMGKIFAIDKYATSLNAVCENRGISVQLGQELVKVDGSNKTATFQNLASKKNTTVDYEMLHVTPHMSPLPFIRASGISDAAGFVEVNKDTTQSLKFPEIFSLGDTSNLPTSKTAAAVAAQSVVTFKNIVSLLEKKPLSAKYNGYTSCPLVTAKGKLILAEFVGPGYGGTPLETFHFDQSKQSSAMYTLKADILPRVYWDLMLNGKWAGPGPFRAITNPFNRN